VRVWSAGSQPADAVHPRAVQVMQEIGIDITTHRPKRVSDIPVAEVDTVITLCAEECVVLPHGVERREGWNLPDPEMGATTEQELLAAFRRLRDELRARIETLKPM
jgi:arsenate reductase